MTKNENLRCPECGSNNIAEILWGLPAFTDELKKSLDEGKVVLDGCCISDDDPRCQCNECMSTFGRSEFAKEVRKLMGRRIHTEQPLVML